MLSVEDQVDVLLNNDNNDDDVVVVVVKPKVVVSKGGFFGFFRQFGIGALIGLLVVTLTMIPVLNGRTLLDVVMESFNGDGVLIPTGDPPDDPFPYEVTEIIEKRTRNSKTFDLNNNKYSWDGSTGSIHYKDNPSNESELWKEIDNIFEPASAPWDWEMINASYHIRVVEDFTAGQIIEFEVQEETVQFQPMALEWTNDLDQIQQVSMPQDVLYEVSNPIVDLLPAVGMSSHQGTIRWNDSYGEGLDFEWKCTANRLNKILEIENFDKLSIPESYIINGGNPVLRFNLIFSPSSNMDIYVDDILWDKSSKMQTFDIIEFRKNDEVLWGFMPLRYWGSDENPEDNYGLSVATLEKRGNKLYISIRVPYEWLQTATYPVFIDTDVDETVGAGLDDAGDTGSALNNDAEFHGLGSTTQSIGCRFQTVTIPNAATIGTAYLTPYFYSSDHDNPQLYLFGEDEDDTLNFHVDNDWPSERTKTTENTDWSVSSPGVGSGYQDSPSIVDVVKEIVDRPSWASNNNMVIIADSHTTTNCYWRTFEYGQPAKLHIEYSGAANTAPTIEVFTLNNESRDVATDNFVYQFWVNDTDGDETSGRVYIDNATGNYDWSTGGNMKFNVSLSGLSDDSWYGIHINCDDGTDNTSKIFTFKTVDLYDNTAPTIEVHTLNNESRDVATDNFVYQVFVNDSDLNETSGRIYIDNASGNFDWGGIGNAKINVSVSGLSDNTWYGIHVNCNDTNGSNVSKIFTFKTVDLFDNTPPTIEVHTLNNESHSVATDNFVYQVWVNDTDLNDTSGRIFVENASGNFDWSGIGNAKINVSISGLSDDSWYTVWINCQDDDANDSLNVSKKFSFHTVNLFDNAAPTVEVHTLNNNTVDVATDNFVYQVFVNDTDGNDTSGRIYTDATGNFDWSGKGNCKINLSISGLAENTEYKVYINMEDDNGSNVSRVFKFTTVTLFANTAPTVEVSATYPNETRDLATDDFVYRVWVNDTDLNDTSGRLYSDNATGNFDWTSGGNRKFNISLSSLSDNSWYNIYVNCQDEYGSNVSKIFKFKTINIFDNTAPTIEVFTLNNESHSVATDNFVYQVWVNDTDGNDTSGRIYVDNATGNFDWTGIGNAKINVSISGLSDDSWYTVWINCEDDNGSNVSRGFSFHTIDLFDNTAPTVETFTYDNETSGVATDNFVYQVWVNDTDLNDTSGRIYVENATGSFDWSGEGNFKANVSISGLSDDSWYTVWINCEDDNGSNVSRKFSFHTVDLFDNNAPTIEVYTLNNESHSVATDNFVYQVWVNDTDYNDTSGRIYVENATGNFDWDGVGNAKINVSISGLSGDSWYTVWINCQDDDSNDSLNVSKKFSFHTIALFANTAPTIEVHTLNNESMDVATDNFVYQVWVNDTDGNDTSGRIYIDNATGNYDWSTGGNLKINVSLSGLSDNTWYGIIVNCNDSSDNTSKIFTFKTVDLFDNTAPTIEVHTLNNESHSVPTDNFIYQVWINDSDDNTTSGRMYIENGTGNFDWSSLGSGRVNLSVSGLSDDSWYTVWVNCEDENGSNVSKKFSFHTVNLFDNNAPTIETYTLENESHSVATDNFVYQVWVNDTDGNDTSGRIYVDNATGDYNWDGKGNCLVNVSISGLSDDSWYTVWINCQDDDSNDSLNVSKKFSFHTLALFDNTAPTIAESSVYPNETYDVATDNFVYQVWVNDTDSNETSGRIYIDNATGNYDWSTGGNMKFNVSVSGLSDNSWYKIFVNCEDTNGSNVSASFKFKTIDLYDNTAPTIEVFTLNNESNNIATDNFVYQVWINDTDLNDTSGRIYVDNATGDDNWDGEGNFKMNVSISGLSDDSWYTVWINCQDTNGSNVSRGFSFHTINLFDNAAPTIEVHTLNNNTIDVPITNFVYQVWVNDTDNNDTSGRIYTDATGDDNWEGKANCLVNVSISGLAYSTLYKVYINCEDDNGSNVSRVFVFTTVASGVNNEPTFSNEFPVNGTDTIPVDTDLSIFISDPDGDSFNYSWACSDGSSGSANTQSDGTKTLVLAADLIACTGYTWWVNATDGNDSENQTYSFTTRCATVPGDGSVLDWNETLTQLCVDLFDDEGDGMEYEIRHDGNVLESGGNFVNTNTTINFTDTVNNSAHWESSKGRITSGTALTATTEFTVDEYNNISRVNGSGVNTSDCSPAIWSHHNFSFDLSDYEIHNITGLEIRWLGYGGYYTGGAKPKWYWGTTMYFDTDGAGWYTAESTTPYTTAGYDPVLEWINYSAHHEMADWIDENGILNVAVEHSSALDCSVIYTDYIELVVTTIGGGVGNGTYCTSNISFWNDACGVEWSWVVYVTDGRGDTSTTTYTFSNAPCTFSGTMLPPTGTAGVCPCCDPICIDVTASYNFNMTVYGREKGGSHWYVWNSYTDISPSEYCFCMDGIMPTLKIHAAAHSHNIHTVDVVDRWYNVTFDYGDAEGMVAVPATGTVTIPSYGHYTANYWAGVTDDSVNPVGNHMAIRVIQNGTDEVDGSYRETEFTTKEKEQHLTGSIHDVFYPGTTLRFQYIGDDTDQKINITDTWSDDNICFYAYIEKESPVEESNPMQFNTTYEWYVNVSKFDNSSLYNETGVYNFTTAVNSSECVDEVGGGYGSDSTGIVGVIGIFGLLSIFWVRHYLIKQKRNNNNNNNNNTNNNYNRGYRY